MAALRGRDACWAIYAEGGDRVDAVTASVRGEFGRIRDVVARAGRHAVGDSRTTPTAAEARRPDDDKLLRGAASTESWWRRRSLRRKGSGPYVSIILGYDPTTLREKVDLAAAGERLDETRRAAQPERTQREGRACCGWSAGSTRPGTWPTSVRQARFSGDREELCLARIRRAQVQQYRGKLEPALIELTSCVDEARDHDWALPRHWPCRSAARSTSTRRSKAALTDFRTAVTSG